MAQVIDVRGVRRRDGHLEVAVQRFHRKLDGRTITLAGLLHLAEPRFFDELRTIVDELEAGGAEVHLEATAAGSEPTYTTGSEVEALKQLGDDLNTVLGKTGQSMGLPWIYQDEGALKPAPTWRGVDVRKMDVVRLLGPGRPNRGQLVAAKCRAFLATYQAAGESVWKRQLAISRFVTMYIDGQCPPSGWTRVVRMAAFRLVKMLKLQFPKRKSAGFSPDHMVMWTYREFIGALAALDTPKDVVMVWHGGHHPGLASVLLRNGFQRDDSATQWLVAIHKVRFDERGYPIPAQE